MGFILCGKGASNEIWEGSSGDDMTQSAPFKNTTLTAYGVWTEILRRMGTGEQFKHCYSQIGSR